MLEKSSVAGVRYKITLAYDGSAYAGWQIQPDRATVQGTLEQALIDLTNEKSIVHGSGRTDRGVHARGQVAHFNLTRSFPCGGLKKALNGLLPADIRVLRVQAVPHDFHARRSAVGKQYRYFIWNAEIMPPFLWRYRTHVHAPLDTRAMRRAAAMLIGRHDFRAFSANPNREVESTVRHLYKLSVRRQKEEILLIAEGDGFLYKMVRSLAGLLIRVGAGALPPDAVVSIINSKERTAQVPTAPPQGLFLWQVRYK